MKRLFGLTGPSRFSNECASMIEDHYKGDFVLLYHNDVQNLKSWLKKCSAFMISGGMDIHPSIYGKPVIYDCNLTQFDFQRDQRELEVIDYAIAKQIPLLAICRGHQLLGIHRGLGEDFEMDLTRCTVIHQPLRHNIQYSKYETMHYIDIVSPNLTIPDAEERRIVRKVMHNKEEKISWVNSFHHQALRHDKTRNYGELSIELLATAPSGWLQDNTRVDIIEAMRGDSWLSVQWHPEFDHDVNTASKTILNMFEKLLG